MESVLKKSGRRGAAGAGKVRSGFTLVELIVVLALIGLLAAVSAGGMLGYTMYSTYKRNNENAKTIFSAAQSAISYYKASGRLEGLRKEVENLTQMPAFVPEEAITDDAGSGSRSVNDTISYLMMSGEEYSAIESAVEGGDVTLETAAVDGQTKLLFNLLNDYVTDVGIYNASICLEFDATDGVVSGVLYSDKGQSFSYGETADGIDITQRDESYRRKVGLGYYSTELSERAPEKVEDLKIKGARMVNAESLDVQWFLEKKYQYLKSAQNYTIEIYEHMDGDTDPKGRLAAKITLEAGTDGASNGVLAITKEEGEHAFVDAASVTLYDKDGNEYPYPASVAAEPIRFHAYLVQDEEYGSGIALSLDVMDSYASEAMIAEAADLPKELLSTYSARRLSYEEDSTHYGLTLDGTSLVSAKVSVSSSAADSGADTESENLLFATKDSEEADGNTVFEVANARHLYNAGLRELANEASAPASTTYKLTRSFDWGGPEGLLHFTGLSKQATDGSGAVYTTMPTIKFYKKQVPNACSVAEDGTRTQYPAFPGLPVLNSGSTLTGKMSEADLEAENKAEGKKEEDGENAEPSDPRRMIGYLVLEPQLNKEGSHSAGLVLKNKGTVADLKLEHVDVRGIIEATNVSGENVGAFCGLNEGTLSNVETVSGYVIGGRNVGGILGSYSGSALMEGLKNGAEVCGVENVGGIVGAVGSGTSLSGASNTGIVYGWTPADGSVGSIASDAPKYIGGIAGYVEGAIGNCASNPVPQAGEDGSTAELTAEEAQKKLHGNYVGGIAGYMSGSAAITGCTVGAGSSAYVLGENFVGGIVGMAAGGSLDGSGGSSSAAVIGRHFVGGIVGSNGAVPDGIAPDEVDHTQAFGSGGTVSNWTYTGLAMAANESGLEESAYVGGIAGVNAGTIQNCSATTASDAALFAELSGASADFVGGIAGCNKGTISVDTVTGVVRGRNFVGGVAGYNDGIAPGSAVISGCTTEEVTVSGDNFTGGIVGLNTSAALLTGSNLSRSADTVTGNSYVGGYAGANIVALSGTTSITPAGNTAEVTANGAFAGGLFGYNRVVTDEQLKTLFQQGADGSSGGDVVQMLSYAGQTGVNAAGTDPVNAAYIAFEIDQKDGGSGSLTIDGGSYGAGTLSAQVFAGGVIGYNASKTKLTIKNYSGSAHVTATSSLATSNLADKNIFAGKRYGADKSYSFSGGIIGYVSENTTLESCNLTAPEVEANAATYLGGLAEVNEGTIIDCSVSAIGTDTRSNVGGIVGVNGYVSEEKPGIIKSSAGTGVIGREVVGGTAAENYGEISGVTGSGAGTAGASAAVTGTDQLGGIAGVNEGTIKQCVPIMPASTGITGTLGGIAGVNNGQILMEDVSGVSASVSAAYVGGIAGVNNGQISKDSTTAAYASIQLDLSGNADALGGIAGRNVGTISGITFGGKIDNTGSIDAGAAKNGASYGGIAGVNDEYGIVELCGLAGETTIMVRGAGYVGGVVGSNIGSAMIRSICKDATEADVRITTNGVAATGGITGLNGGRAIVQDVCSLNPWMIQANATTGSVGGIVGLHTSSTGLLGLKNYATVSLEDNSASGTGNGGVIDENNPGMQPGSAAGGAAGGIVGRVASDPENPGVRITVEDCENRGMVESAGKAGGILGEWAADAGGSISGCNNGVTSEPSAAASPVIDEGDAGASIKSELIAGAAGIVGSFTNLSGSVTISTCRNFGIIQGQLGAGIAALAGIQTGSGNGTVSNPTVNITDCANAGCFMDGGAGIAVYDSDPAKSGTIALNLNLCRNYGRPTGTEDNTFAGLVANVRNGAFDADSVWLADDPKKITIENSIGVAAVKYPTAPMAEYDDDDAYKAEFAKVSARYGKADVGPEGYTVFYYSASSEGEERLPLLIKTAGIGFAVSYANGLYKSPLMGEEKRGVDRTYLKATLGLDAEDTIDPNSEQYAKDCRGNYNRLDQSVIRSCLNLEAGVIVDVKKTPPASGVEAANNGGFLDITWKNEKADNTEPEPGEPDDGSANPGDTTGKVYKTVLELRLYDNREAAENADLEEDENVVYRATFFGGTTTSHTVRVSASWMRQWINVSVVNYSYSGEKQEEDVDTYVIQILPSLLDPELEVRLSEDGTYELQLANLSRYADKVSCQLRFTVKAETIGESVKTSASVTTQIMLSELEENSYKLNQLDGIFVEEESQDVRLTFTEVQVCPVTSAGIGAEGTDTEQTEGSGASDGKAPSAKKTVQVLIPAKSKLTTGFIPSYSEGTDITRTDAVNFNLKVQPAVYRAEVLWDIEEKDYLLKDIVVSSARQEVTAADAAAPQLSSLIARLAIPVELADGLARARVYPLEMNGGMAKLAYLAGENLSLQDLINNGYLNVEASAAGSGQAAGNDGAQVGGVIDAQQTQAGGVIDAQQAQVGEVIDTQQFAAEEEASAPEGDQIQNIAAETVAETEPEEPQKALRTATVAQGYAIEKDMASGLFRVYRIPIAGVSPASCRTWEEKKDETMTTSAGGAGGSGLGSRVGSVGGGSAQPASETESETEELVTEPQTETETQQTEQTQPQQTETRPPQTETQASPELLPPQSAVLIPAWDSTIGKDKNDKDNALSEEDFRNGLTLMVGLMDGADSYRMRVGFYSERASLSSGSLQPDPQKLLTEVPGYDSKTEYQITTMDLGTYVFSNLPLSYAGKHMCVQFRSVSADGQQTSDWSEYIWLQLPRVSLKAPELQQTTVVEEHTMNTYAYTATPGPDGQPELSAEPTETSTVELSHLAYTWAQNVPKAGEQTKVGEDARGYVIDLYRMLGEDVQVYDELYLDPTITINLMFEDKGFYLERDFTQEEQDEWAEDHKEDHEPLPDRNTIWAYELTEETADDLIKGELAANPNRSIYELLLDKPTIGSDSYAVSYTQDVPELGRREIKDIYPRIQIRRDTDDNGQVTRIQYTLILPDVEPTQAQASFLYDYTRAYVTHSVIVQQLQQSVYDEKPLVPEGEEEPVVADRLQWSYLADLSTLSQEENGTESLRTYQRTLSADWKYDKQFDAEKENLKFEGYERWRLLARNYKPAIIWNSGSAESYVNAMQQAMQTDAPAGIANVDDELSFSLDLDGNMIQDTEGTPVDGGAVPGVDDQMVIPDDSAVPEYTGDGSDLGYVGDGIVVEEEVLPVEPQTQAPTEPQTQPQTEPQTLAPIEPQTQAISELAQPAEASMNLETPTEAAMSLEGPIGEVVQ